MLRSTKAPVGVATFPTSCGLAYGHSGVDTGFLIQAWTTKNGQRSVVMAVNATPTKSVDDNAGTVLNLAVCGP